MSPGAPIPRHIAVIMDGNGRWAEQRGLPRVRGHEAGADSVRELVRVCARLGVQILTLYSFSTENWKRPHDEVEALMSLLGRYLSEERGELGEKDIRLRAIGQIGRLPPHVHDLLLAVCEETRMNEGLVLQLALSYGGRDEIARAARRLAERVEDGELAAHQIDERAVEAQLWTAGQPDPDLVIRTSGELRLSNFLLWQAAYSELYVTDVLWPDFREADLHRALAAYASRSRRFGDIDARAGA